MSTYIYVKNGMAQEQQTIQKKKRTVFGLNKKKN